MVGDIIHEGLRTRLREEGVSCQRIKSWKNSKNPDDEARKAPAPGVLLLPKSQSESSTAVFVALDPPRLTATTPGIAASRTAKCSMANSISSFDGTV